MQASLPEAPREAVWGEAFREREREKSKNAQSVRANKQAEDLGRNEKQINETQK